MKSTIRKLMRNIGWDLVSFDPRYNFEARKMHLLQTFSINHVLDIGANIGQFGTYLRNIGYNGNIVSFEPMKEAYSQLAQVAKDDVLWKTVCSGIGSTVTNTSINISINSYSSSIKQVLPRHLDAHPESAVIAQEIIALSTVDFIFKDLMVENGGVMLKSDTQGYESEVLEGAKNSLSKIDIVVLEMSLEPLYSDQELLPELVNKMTNLGFKLAILEPCDEDYESLSILQMDGWFVKKNYV